MTTDPTRAQADEALTERALEMLRMIRLALKNANELPDGPINDTIWMPGPNETLFDYIEASIESLESALRQRLAADAQPLEAKADERDQALQFLAGLHPELTIDGPPMAVAERIWDAVMSDREALADKIKNMERNLENFRQHFARAGSPPAQSEGSRG